MTNSIQTIRKERKLTQQELADLVGVNRVTIARYENGDCTPSWENAEKIAAVLGVKLEELKGSGLTEA